MDAALFDQAVTAVATFLAGSVALLVHLDARRLERRHLPTPMSINSYQWLLGSVLVLGAAHGGSALGVINGAGLLAIIGFMTVVIPAAYMASRCHTTRHGDVETMEQQRARQSAAEQVRRDTEYWSALRVTESERSFT